MPRLRLLADSSLDAGAIGGEDRSMNPVYDVGAGEVVPVVLDATGWAGSDTVSSSEWEAPDGATISARQLSGAVASCNVFVPDEIIGSRVSYKIRNTLTLGGGALRRTTVWLRAMSR